MSVLAMIKLKGDADKILAAKREIMDPVAQVPFRAHGHQSQIIARDEEGVLVFNLWESPEGRDLANADPAMQEARQKMTVATGADAEFANWEVVAHSITAP